MSVKIIELHKTGMRALTAALGEDGAKAFLDQYKGRGDFTKDRHTYPQRTHNEFADEVMRLQRERLKSEAVTA